MRRRTARCGSGRSLQRGWPAGYLPVATGGARPSAVAHDRQLSGKLKLVAAILKRPVIEKVLNHLGLHARAPPRAGASPCSSTVNPSFRLRQSRSGDRISTEEICRSIY